MEFVNQHRVDAHAKVIEDDDYGILKIALKWLQDRVDAFLA